MTYNYGEVQVGDQGAGRGRTRKRQAGGGCDPGNGIPDVRGVASGIRSGQRERGHRGPVCYHGLRVAAGGRTLLDARSSLEDPFKQRLLAMFGNTWRTPHVHDNAAYLSRTHRVPTSGLEPLTCSLRVIAQALQGLSNPAFIRRFRFSDLPYVARYCVTGGVRVVTVAGECYLSEPLAIEISKAVAWGWVCTGDCVRVKAMFGISLPPFWRPRRARRPGRSRSCVGLWSWNVP